MEINSFTVLPMSQRFSLEAGKTYTGHITVVNPADSTEDFPYKVTVSPYWVQDENYLADLTSTNDRTKIVEWIEISNPTGILKPNETREIEFRITVPETAPKGGQYAALMVSSNAMPTASSGIMIDNVYELASIVYATVEGEFSREGEVVENTIPGFSTSAPLAFSALIKNDGNTHEDAVFVVSVKNLWNGEMIVSPDSDEGKFSELIMPGTTKYVTHKVTNLPTIGVVKAVQHIYYNGDVSTTERDVFICPVWFMALVAVTIAAVVTVIVRAITKHKRKKHVF